MLSFIPLENAIVEGSAGSGRSAEGCHLPLLQCEETNALEPSLNRKTESPTNYKLDFGISLSKPTVVSTRV